MSLFDRLGNAPNVQFNARDVLQNAQEALNRAVETAKANYTTMIQQKGWSVPAGMTDPQQMAQHLVQSGQVPQSRLAQAMQMAQRLMGGSAR